MAARRPASLLKAKSKDRKPRVSRSEAYRINVKYMGEEPVFTKPLTPSEYGNALNWYNCMADKDEAREYTYTYLKNEGRLEELKTLKRVPDTWLNLSCAWVCRMLTLGYVLPGNPKEYIDIRLNEQLLKAKKEEPEVAKPSIQDRTREKSHQIIGEIEEMIDNETIFSMYDWLKARSVPAMYAPMIIAYYAPWLCELIEAYEGKDPQLKEAYSYLTKKQLAERIKFFHALISDAEKYAGVAKKTRAPRKPRPVSKEKLLKNLKFQKEDADFKIASINPEKILGAQELWCFNTKYKVLTVFRALDRGGLQVKRSSIVGFDEKTSMSRGCGRGADKIVQTVLTAGKITLRKVMDDLKTVRVLGERINENTILLKVVNG
ncbi:hypothetical protein UFOVP132_131 [uncultured Caudovirales phage]|uniref:Uncharacterized protein n=1 Tax=uncultured Caudovirales phage TaxID=2100421 RepID=A0A6J5LAB6_9CAUD|nr:hypothetical protein UFOVP132_131 [uncultured Caudovirales phage]